MSQSESFVKLQNIFRYVFDDESLVIARETSADDIDGWDSLTHVNLIMVIEKEFAIKFSLKEMAGFRNVGDMADLIVSKVGK